MGGKTKIKTKTYYRSKVRTPRFNSAAEVATQIALNGRLATATLSAASDQKILENTPKLQKLKALMARPIP